MSIVIIGMLSNILSILTTTLARVQTISGTEAAALAIKAAIVSVTQAIWYFKCITPITLPWKGVIY